MGERSMLSVVIPAHNEEENISNTANVIRTILTKAEIAFELLFIDDGSKDTTYTCITKEGKSDVRIRGIKFSRNFGKEAAILAGLRKAKGDCVAVIDCDLQHPPECLVKMYRLWEQGYQIIEGVKASRGKESFAHKIFAGIFYQAISKAVGIDMKTSSDFKLLDRKVVDAIASMPEKDTFFRALTYWVGFQTTQVSYEVAERKFGKTKWSIWSLIRYAVNNVTSFTSLPLQLITILGIILLIFGFVLGIQTLCKYLVGNAAEGFTTVILLLLMIGGSLMLSLGVIGIYIAKIYNEVKQRPQYLIQEETDEMNFFVKNEKEKEEIKK